MRQGEEFDKLIKDKQMLAFKADLERQELANRAQNLAQEVERLRKVKDISDSLSRQVQEWDFNLHGVAADELPPLCFNVLIGHSEFHTLGLNMKRLWRFCD